MACIYGIEQPCDECRMCGKDQGIQTADIGEKIVGNCDGCKNDNTEECMHCMRAYSDCYESEDCKSNVYRRNRRMMGGK